MSRRDNADARCATCRMHATLCICSLVPRLATRTRVLLLVHYREERKPTNTGQLAARCLDGSRIEVIGDRARPLPVPLLGPDDRAVVLQPSHDAVPLATFAAGAPLTLVVPDGNWRQAAKMAKRVPGLAALPRVSLEAPSPTAYRLRAEPQKEGLATLEAIAHALRVLEGDAGPAIEEAMLHVFDVMVSRTLYLRGALPAAEVVGGLP